MNNFEVVRNQLIRQNFCCYGCGQQFHSTTVDDYINNPMPLVCENCTETLENAEHNPLTLRRLMATLDYKQDKHNVYLIGTLRNREIMNLAERIRKADFVFDVHDEWITPGSEADTYWQEYENNRNRPWAEALKSRGCQNIYLFDRAYMDHADTIVLCMPAGKSGMCELGYAAGIGKNTIIYLNETDPERYEVMPNFADHVVKTETELINKLKELANVRA